MKIKTNALTKRFGEKVAVNNLNIEIRPGQILGLLGPNGAGKSTAIKMLTGQSKPTTGEIVIDGESHSHVPDNLRGKIGVMPQEVIIWDELTVKENLLFSASMQNMNSKDTRKRTDFLIESLNLQPEVNTYAKNLSGGYKRRLNLAISIVHDPEVIFLDEPSPGIDAQNRRFLWEFIKSLGQSGDYAIVLTDHYIEEAEKLSDYVVIIDHGSIVAEGSVQELKNKHADGSESSLEDVFLNLTGHTIRE